MFTTTFMTAARAKETMREVAGVTELPNFTVQSLPRAPLTIMRLTYDKTTDGVVVNGLGNDDAFLVTLSLRDYPAFDHWCEGRFIRGSAGKAGSSSLSDLNFRHSTRLDFSFDSLHLYLPRAALNALTDDEGAPRISSLRSQPGTSVEDTVLSSLGTLLLPALSQPQHASRLFVDHVATAMLAHVAETFGDLQVGRRQRGGLAPRQEKRAKELLSARLDGEVTIEQLARECGISRSHFARAFRITTGQPPHRWLLAQRIERAEQLLLNSRQPLAEIASLCGFADQSHFTRAFRQYRGLTPGAWRRLRAS